MALYKDGNPVSGLNSIPRLTLAQYNALNVKPEFWVRTDAPESYKKLSADQVSYDSNNTVKDKIDENELHLTAEKSIVISSSITAGAEVFLGYAGNIVPELVGHNVLGVQLRDVSDGNVHCLYMNSNGLFDRCALSKSSLSIKIRFLYND